MPGAGTLVGRSTELEMLVGAYADARAGQPTTIIVEGPPGVGKSALLQSFAARVDDDTRVLTAVGDETERGLAYGLLQQLLLGIEPAVGDRLALAFDGQAAPPEPLAAGVEMLAAIGGLQDGGPLVIVVDEAHWSDRASMEALTFALRRLRADQVLAVVGTRAEATDAVPAGLHRLAQGQTGSRLALAGLTPDQLSELSLVAGLGELTPGAARRLHAHTEGIPLYAIELLRALGPDAFRDGGPLPVPPSLASLFLAQLTPCADPTRHLVRCAAVLGRESRIELMGALAELDDPGPSLDEAVQAGLLVAGGSGGGAVRFRHPLIRDAVYLDLAPDERVALHLRAADLLGEDAGLDHRVRAATAFDQQLADVLRARARQDAERRYWPMAADHMLAAARLHPDAAIRADSLLYAAELMATGSDFAGVALLAEEIASLPPGPWRDLVLGHLSLGAGRLPEATALLEHAIDEGDPAREPERYATAATLLALCRLLQGGRGTETAELSRRALRLAPAGSTPRLAWLSVLFGEAVAGRPREALAAAPAPEDVPAGWERLGLLVGRAMARLYTDDLDGARRDLVMAEGPLVRDGPGPITWPALLCRAEVELRAGRWEDALTASHLGLSIATDTDDLLAVGFLASEAAGIHALRGEWRPAQESLTLSAQRAEASGAPAHRIQHALAEARRAWARSEPEAVVLAVAPLVELADEDVVREHGVIPWRDLQAEALVRLGRLDEAEAIVVGLESQAEQRDLRSTRAAALRARAMLESAMGATDAAMQRLEEAREAAGLAGMPLLAAIVALEMGALLRRSGRRRDAGERLDEAVAVFRDLGAEPFLERAERELDGTGRRRTPRGRAHLDLTPQEVSVARLVTRGLSNREAAAELVVSVKTIEYHLSNVYAKLGVTSRTQLMARFPDAMSAAPTGPEAGGLRSGRRGRLRPMLARGGPGARTDG